MYVFDSGAIFAYIKLIGIFGLRTAHQTLIPLDERGKVLNVFIGANYRNTLIGVKLLDGQMSQIICEHIDSDQTYSWDECHVCVEVHLLARVVKSTGVPVVR